MALLRWKTGTILCICAALAWPTAVTAHSGGSHGSWSRNANAERTPETPAATSSQSQPAPPQPQPATPQPSAHAWSGATAGNEHGAGSEQGAPEAHASAHEGNWHGHAGNSGAHEGSSSAHEGNTGSTGAGNQPAAGHSSGNREGGPEAGHSPKEGRGSGNGEAKGSGSSLGSSNPTSPVTTPVVTLPHSTPNATPASSGNGSAAAASANASAAPAPAASAPASAPAATGSSPSVVGSTPEGATVGGSTHHRAAHGGSHGAAATLGVAGGLGAPVSGAVAAATAAGGGAAPAAGAPNGGNHRTANAGHASAPSSGLTPAIHTVERIANVVPRGIWIIMAILGVLSALLAGRAWLASTRARRLERQRGHLAEEVGVLQAALLPTIPEHFGPVRASVAYRPAEGPAAGGDFYDVFALEDGRMAVIVGDVSGHGPTALPQTALIRYTLRTYLDAGLQPRAALHAAAVSLDHQLDSSFATVVLATYDARDRTLTYACAGHPPPVVIAPEPLEPVLAGSAPPIGVGLPTGTRQTILRLPVGAAALFFTDGIVEARAGGELFGVERLTQALDELGPDATAENLLERVVAATDRRPDDMAACLLHLDGAPAPGGHGNGSGAAHGGLVHSEELEIDRAALGGDRLARFLAACGLSTARAADVIGAAHVVVESAGEAVLRLRLDGARTEVEVLPHNTGVLHLAKRPGPGKEAHLVSGQ
jgi:hypothetical protein